MAHDTIANDEQINAAKLALENNGHEVLVVEDGETAKQATLDLLPKGAEVLTVTSRTLETIGLLPAINESSEYDAVRPKLDALWGKPDKKSEQRKLGAAPDFVVGSVHAVTQDGRVLVASATGSQLPAYAYGAGRVIWVVGAQKIVKDLNEAFTRLKEYVFPLENERALQAYGTGSNISKTLVVNKEVAAGRITIVLVKEKLGF